MFICHRPAIKLYLSHYSKGTHGAQTIARITLASECKSNSELLSYQRSREQK